MKSFVAVYTYREEHSFEEVWRMSHALPFKECSIISSIIDYLPYWET